MSDWFDEKVEREVRLKEFRNKFERDIERIVNRYLKHKPVSSEPKEK